MAIEFDEVLLDPSYSALARGGPEFLTLNLTNLAGFDQTAIRRYHYVSRYEISYAEMDPERQQALREFHILSWGGAYAFRFLAPDLSTLDGELVTDGAYNPPQVGAGDEPLSLYLIKTYRRFGRSYQRRIVKPAWTPMTLQIGETAFDVEVDSTGPEGAPLYGGSLYGAGPEAGVTLDYRTGTLTLTPEARGAFAGQTVRVVRGSFHLPVLFGSDWNQMATDPAAIGEWTGVTVKEVLPAALGILI